VIVEYMHVFLYVTYFIDYTCKTEIRFQILFNVNYSKNLASCWTILVQWVLHLRSTCGFSRGKMSLFAMPNLVTSRRWGHAFIPRLCISVGMQSLSACFYMSNFGVVFFL